MAACWLQRKVTGSLVLIAGIFPVKIKLLKPDDYEAN